MGFDIKNKSASQELITVSGSSITFGSNDVTALLRSKLSSNANVSLLGCDSAPLAGLISGVLGGDRTTWGANGKVVFGEQFTVRTLFKTLFVQYSGGSPTGQTFQAKPNFWRAPGV